MNKLSLSTILVALCGPVCAVAEPIENYFRADPYSCRDKTYLAEWSVFGDTADAVTLNVFVRRTNRSNFDGSTWKLQASDLETTVDINGSNGRPLYRISGILTETPEVISLDRKGEVVPECDQVLKQVASPTERYADLLDLLKTPAPQPRDGLSVYHKLEQLPPLKMLPTLEQRSTKTELKTLQRSFWDNYRAAASTTETPELLAGIAEVWLTRKDDSRRRWHSENVLLAQNAFAKSLMSKDESPATMRVTETNLFCARIDQIRNEWDWTNYLELATGLPVEFWTSEIAKDYLSKVENCENNRTFVKTLSERWPEIEARGAGLKRLEEERDKLAAMEVTLDSVAAANWLQTDRKLLNELREVGVHHNEVSEFLEPTLQELRQKAYIALSAELSANGAATALNLPAQLSFCREQKEKLQRASGSGRELQNKVFEACENAMAGLVEQTGLKMIEDAKQNLLSRPGTLSDLLETKGYDIRSAMPPLRRAYGPFQGPMNTISRALNAAEIEVEKSYRDALATATSEIKAAAAETDPLSRKDGPIDQICGQISNPGLMAQRLRPLINQCNIAFDELRAKRRVAECDMLWKEFDVPAEIPEGHLYIPSMMGDLKKTSIREFLCEADRENVDLSVFDNSGLIWSEYRLVRREKIRGTEVVFSVRLNEPESDDAGWTVDDPELSQGNLDPSKTGSSDDLIKCAIIPQACIAE
ncbi:hypothetical protein [Halovulum sp. GXIMD14793]